MVDLIYDKIVDLIGVVPYGAEPLVYCVSCIVLVWLLSVFFSVLWTFFSMIGGGKRG